MYLWSLETGTYVLSLQASWHRIQFQERYPVYQVIIEQGVQALKI